MTKWWNKPQVSAANIRMTKRKLRFSVYQLSDGLIDKFVLLAYPLILNRLQLIVESKKNWNDKIEFTSPGSRNINLIFDQLFILH